LRTVKLKGNLSDQSEHAVILVPVSLNLTMKKKVTIIK
jgi:hypothetical protein